MIIQFINYIKTGAGSISAQLEPENARQSTDKRLITHLKKSIDSFLVT